MYRKILDNRPISKTQQSYMRKVETLIKEGRVLYKEYDYSKKDDNNFEEEGCELFTDRINEPKKKLYITTRCTPRKYFYKHGNHLEILVVEKFFGKFWHLCTNLEKIYIRYFNFCNMDYLYNFLPKNIKEIHICIDDPKTILKLVEYYPNTKIVFGDIFNDSFGKFDSKMKDIHINKIKDKSLYGRNGEKV